MVNLSDLRETLELSLDPGRMLPAHVGAFEAWALSRPERLRAWADDAITSDGQQRHPEHIAAMGYAAAAGLLSEAEKTLLREDVAQLSGRAFFASGRPPRFEIDGIALMGVALAVKVLGSSDRRWLLDLLAKSEREVSGDAWHTGLIRGAERCLAQSTRLIEPSDLCLVLAARGIGEVSTVDMNAAWREASALTQPSQTPGRDAIRLAAFDDLLERQRQIVPRAATRADIVTVLQSITQAMRRWTYEDKGRTANAQPVRWEVENEYHVQNLLWVILAPLFADLEDEENLPSLGHKHPRADIGIPSLRTIVEVKFMRNAGQAALAGIIEEVAADASLYLSKQSTYDAIIALVWDDRAQTEQHYELRMGLEGISGIVAAVVLSRPQKMARVSKPKGMKGGSVA